MNIKNIFASGVIALFLFGTQLKAQTVYITENGKKYHAKNCNLAKTGKKGIELADAKKKGLEPCKACKVESEIKPTTDKPKDKAKSKK